MEKDFLFLFAVAHTQGNAPPFNFSFSNYTLSMCKCSHNQFYVISESQRLSIS
jgi:hypothetical protein